MGSCSRNDDDLHLAKLRRIATDGGNGGIRARTGGRVLGQLGRFRSDFGWPHVAPTDASEEIYAERGWHAISLIGLGSDRRWAHS